MQSNVAVCGLVEWVEWEVTDAWSFFGPDLYHLSEGFRWDLEPEEWGDEWREWDPWPEDTIEAAWGWYSFTLRWAEDYLGYPMECRTADAKLPRSCESVSSAPRPGPQLPPTRLSLVPLQSGI